MLLNPDRCTEVNVFFFFFKWAPNTEKEKFHVNCSNLVRLITPNIKLVKMFPGPLKVLLSWYWLKRAVSVWIKYLWNCFKINVYYWFSLFVCLFLGKDTILALWWWVGFYFISGQTRVLKCFSTYSYLKWLSLYAPVYVPRCARIILQHQMKISHTR